MFPKKFSFFVGLALLALCIPVDTFSQSPEGVKPPSEVAVTAVAAAAVASAPVEELAGEVSRQLVIGPKMTPISLPPGPYLIITIPTDATKAPIYTKFVIGDSDDPDPPNPPDPDKPINIQIRNMLNPIVDPDKARTANDLVMGLNVGPLGLIESGDIKTSKDAEEATNATIKFMLQARGKTEAWRPFSEGMKDLIGGCTDLTGCSELLKTAVTELKAVK